MEQFWYTWSRNGPQSGFQIRAASPGFRERNKYTQDLLPYTRYKLPEGTRDADPRYAPVCLSLTDTNYGRLLLHKVYTGLDAAKRPGAFFSHLVLLNEPSAPITLRDAIDLWDSNFWRVSESENDPSVLPVIGKHDLLPSTRNPFEQFGPNVRIALETLLQNILLAFLTHENRRRFYILAPSQVVTALIWGLAHSLPQTFRWMSEITFTTYDDDVKTARELIVGTFRFAGSPSQDLPDACYSRDVLALTIDSETFEIRRVSLPDLDANPLYAHFAAYAARCLVSCSTDALASLVQDAERRLIKSLPAFLDLYEQDINGKPLSLEQILVALRQKTSDEGQLSKPKNLNVLIEALIKSSPSEKGVEVALQAFCRRTDGDAEATAIHRELVGSIVDAINARITTKESSSTIEVFRLVQTLTYLAPVVQNTSLWLMLLNTCSQKIQPFAPVDPNSLFPWETRTLLLTQWVQIVDLNKEKAARVWLKAAWSDWKESLSRVPEAWRQFVIYYRLTKADPIPEQSKAIIADVVEAYGDDTIIPYIQRFVQEARFIAEVKFFICKLIEYQCPRRLELLFAVLTSDQKGVLTPELLPALSFQDNDLFDFVKKYIPQLIPYAVYPSIADFIKYYLHKYFERRLSGDPATQLTETTWLVSQLQQQFQQVDNTPHVENITTFLVERIVDMLQKCSQEGASQPFFKTLDALRQLVPAQSTNALWAWQTLLVSLPSPRQRFPWETRQLCLIQWVALAQFAQVPENIVDWLDVPWSEMERLLTLSIPREWQLHALMKRIEDPSELPAEAQMVIENAEPLCLQVLERFVAYDNEKQAMVVVRFLIQILQLKYHKRLSLLLKILETDKIGHVTARILPEVPIADLHTFVEEYLYKLMPYVAQHHTARFIEQCIDGYFANLPPENLLTSLATRNLLANLVTILTLPLPEELRVRIRCWQEIAKFLETDIHTVDRSQIYDFASALARGGLSRKTRWLLNDTLATHLAGRDFDEEPRDLTIFVYLLGQALNGQACFLQSMSMVAGERFGRSIRTISEYISLVLSETHFTPDLEKERFLKNSLNYLLIQISSGSEEEFQKIQSRIEALSTPAEIATWQTFLASSRLASGWTHMPWYTFWKPAYWQDRPHPRAQTAPWYTLWRTPYRKSRAVHKKLREAIRGRMVTEIAEVSSILDEPIYLNQNERRLVSAAQVFVQAYNQEDAREVASIYQKIWETYPGEICFTEEEMRSIRETINEQKMYEYVE